MLNLRPQTAWLPTFATVFGCAGPAVPSAVSSSPSCSSNQPVPVCDGHDEALSVETYVNAVPAVGKPIRITGRLVPGAACCLAGCPPRCDLALGLVPQDERSMTPRSGPLVLLTVADRHGEGFRTVSPRGDLVVSCPARHDPERGTLRDYCCELDVSGQPVVVTGRVVPPPRIALAEPECSAPDLDMPPVAPACSASASWRESWTGLAAIAVEELCQR